MGFSEEKSIMLKNRTDYTLNNKPNGHFLPSNFVENPGISKTTDRNIYVVTLKVMKKFKKKLRGKNNFYWCQESDFFLDSP